MFKFIVTCAVLFAMQIGYASANSGLQLMRAPFSRSNLDTVRQYLLDNIATENHFFVKDNNGAAMHSVPGAVLASPSNRGPQFGQDYQFHWVRDAAITMYQVAEMYKQASSIGKTYLRPYLINYINFEHKVQSQPSRSGEDTFGQPKFNIDGTVWDGPWGRPQNDGSALRAITMMNIASIFLAEGQEKYVRETMLPMISADLAYVAWHWQDSNFDLWEELNDTDHFFTKMVQRKALKQGADFIRSMGDLRQADFCENTVVYITASLDKHWNEARGYFSETIYQQHNKGGGMDTSILLGILLGELASDDVFSPVNDRVISSVFYLRNSFSSLYRINIDHADRPPLLGRYPSDVYDGDQSIYGNPWVLTTNALAQYYYRLADIYLRQGKIVISKSALLLFQQIDPVLANKEESVVATDNPVKFYTLINALIAEGDHLLQNVKSYSVCYNEYSCYHLSEQIDRASGKQVSARDLTWSYASLLAASQSRTQLLS